MSVISLTITESSEQIIDGVPRTISISTNIPSSIFYTLDDTDPTTFSTIYTGPITTPTDKSILILKVYATNGIDSSSIFSKTYYSTIADSNTRLPHSAVANLDNNKNNSLYPFGSNTPNPNFNYLNPSEAGINVNDPNYPSITTGYDGFGNPVGKINTPINQYQFKYSTTNNLGEIKPGVGTLPAKTTIIGKTTPIEYTQEESSRSDTLFNPKALVIFQDASKEKPSDPVHINRSNFSMENQEIVRNGNLLYNGGLDSPTTTGSFVKSHYNPRTNEITYYYYDSSVNRWIISKAPYEQKNKDVGKLYNMVFSRPNGGNGFVFKWLLFQRRILT